MKTQTNLLLEQAGGLVFSITGRCISADHEAQASIRIIPIVCCLGEAAGVAASVACREGVDTAKANIKEIQRILVENGAVIH